MAARIKVCKIEFFLMDQSGQLKVIKVKAPLHIFQIAFKKIYIYFFSFCQKLKLEITHLFITSFLIKQFIVYKKIGHKA